MTGYENVIAALEAKGCNDGYGFSLTTTMYLCPAHSDSRPSLSVKEGDDGRALIHCFAGCHTSDVVAALHLELSDLFTLGSGGAVADAYVYEDEQGQPLIRVLRLSPKGFTQQHWDGSEIGGTWKPGTRGVRKVLYKLPQVLKAAANGETIYVVEGEKDVESLLALGYNATTAIGGANKWSREYSDALRGASVVVLGDADDAGRESARAIGSALAVAGVPFVERYPATGKDISDHLAAGLGLSDLVVPEIDTSDFGPFEWSDYETPTVEWLYEPYVPRGTRVLAFGKAGSLKSLWAMWVAARLSNEGHKVAYFSLEMSPSELAKRIKACHVTAENFTAYQRFDMRSPSHVMQAIRAFKDHSLIVIDSWSSAHSGADNDEVARLDNEVFKPIIEQTGATLLILDNTGNDVWTDKGRVKQDRARGASAKHDKMDYALWFDKPSEGDNYRTRIVVRKVRLDYPQPAPKTFATGRGDVEFYEITDDGHFGDEAWPYERGSGGAQPSASVSRVSGGDAVRPGVPDVSDTPDPLPSTQDQEPTPGSLEASTEPAKGYSETPLSPLQEKLALARLKDTFRTYIEDQTEEAS